MPGSRPRTIHALLTGCAVPDQRVELDAGLTMRRLQSPIESARLLQLKSRPQPASSLRPMLTRSPAQGTQDEPSRFSRHLQRFVSNAEIVVVPGALPAGIEPEAVPIWIVELIRLQGKDQARLVLVTNRPIDEHLFDHPQKGQVSEAVFFDGSPLLRLGPGDPWADRLLPEDALWIRANWLNLAPLIEAPRFEVAMLAAMRSAWADNLNYAQMIIWGGIEALFSPGGPELSQQVSSLLATFLRRPGEERYALYRRARRLYASRSRAVHGTKRATEDDVNESYNLLRESLLKCIEEQRLPDKKAEFGKLFLGD